MEGNDEMIRLLQRCLFLACVMMATTAIAAMTPGQACQKSASDSLRSCVKSVGRLQQECYQTTGSVCDPGDPDLAAALAKISDKVLAKCIDQATVESAGYGTLLTPAALVTRLANACTTAIASLAARCYGGPNAVVRVAASEEDQSCLDSAWRYGQSLIAFELRQQSGCIRKAGSGRTCDTARLASKLAARESSTADRITSRCPTLLASLVAVSPTVFARRAAADARCLVATAHGATSPLSLDCGPRAAVPVPARGVITQVVLPSAVWGSRCGDGSDYAFSIRLAPEGSPVENVVVHMQGGGFCGDGPSCAAKNPGLFQATSDTMPTGGMMSNTDATNPFRDWTKVSLPYCTQDLHIGGGVATAYPEITVQRYGALNVRAAMRYVRDVVWAEMNAEDSEGYRADRPRMLFSGSSAGGYGAAYNYHWVLDDLGWIHTSAAPDAGLAMDNGTATGVIAIGTASIPASYPGWNMQPYLPPYCFTGDCAEIFVNLEQATAPRLTGAAEQQFLHISNQVDTVQQGTTLFPSMGAFVNTLRSSYCSVQGTTRLHAYLRASTTPIHGELNTTSWDNAIVDGTRLRDWLGGAMTTPTAVADKVEEGTLVPDISGVLPFPCAVD